MTAIYSALGKIMKEIPGVSKDQKNPSQGYKYRGIDDALSVLHPLCCKHGVVLQMEDLDTDIEEAGKTKAGATNWRAITRGRVNFVSVEDGSSFACSVIGEGVDTGDKAIMKSQANALKYLIWYTFLVPTDEKKDSEAFEDSPATPQTYTQKATQASQRTKGKAKGDSPGEGEKSDTGATAASESMSLGELTAALSKVKTKEGLEAHRQEVREWCHAQPKGSKERAMGVSAWKAAEERVQGVAA